MTTHKEALTLALEALERIAYFKLQPDTIQNLTDHYSTAIKEALAQPEQEPHSWYSAQEDEWMTHKTRKEHGFVNEPLYTTPPQRTWVGLTTDDWDEIKKQVNYNFEMTTGEYAERISHLVEAKLKEKNTK